MAFWSARLLSAIMEVLARLVTLIAIKMNNLKQSKAEARPDGEPLL